MIGARLVHGEAVAIGLACAFRFSTRLGPLRRAGRGRGSKAICARSGLPTRIRDIPGWAGTADAILDAMAQDKKVKRGALTFILARASGRASSPGVEADGFALS